MLFLVAVFVTVFTLLLNYLNLRWKKRRFYQLLSEIPGPRGLPFLGNALEFTSKIDELPKNLERTAAEYGLPFKGWIGPAPFVVFARPEDCCKLLNNPNCQNRGKYLARFARSILGDGIILSDVSKWKCRRKLIATTFAPKILDTFVPLFMQQNVILVQLLRKHVDKEAFDVWNYFSRAALDSLCSTVMDSQLQSQTKDSKYTKAATGILELTFLRLSKIWLQVDWIFGLSSYGKIYKTNLHIMDEFTTKVIRKKHDKLERNLIQEMSVDNEVLDKNPKRKVFLDLLLELTATDQNFTFSSLKEEVDTLMIAGYDTTATTNSFCLLALAMHQEIQQKVYDEIYGIFGNSDRPLETTDLPRLRYLEMVIKEVLRLYPTVPIFVREIKTDLHLENYTIPTGTNAVVCLNILHRNADLWKDPLQFNPDRFSPESAAKRYQYSFLPFGAGPRNCVGYKYAMMIVKVMLTTILRAYHISTPTKENDMKLEFKINLKLVGGFWIKIQERKRIMVFP